MTKMQAAILQAIKDYIEKHGYAPSVREIGAAVGLKSSCTVHTHLQKMIDDGVLETDHPGSPRAIRIPEEELALQDTERSGTRFGSSGK